ncbi:MAG: glycosyltransferase [Paludibacteraceae bacterium]|nr:glycosyltransferase [Paludibacteraceae bacterium]
MRILHIITSLRTGGAEKLMVDLLPKLRDLDNEVEILLFDGTRTPFYDQLESSGIQVNVLRVGGSVYNPANIFALRPYLKRFDIIHAHNTACQFFLAIAKKITGASCKIVTTEHSTSNRRRGHSFFKAVDDWMYHQYKKIICVSEISAQNIRDYVGDPEMPIVVIPNGIDYRKYSEALPNPEIIDHYVKSHRAIMVAGFRYEKDHPTVIKAFSLLPANYHLFLVGDGSRHQEYESYVRELGCDDKIHFLGVRSDVPSLLKASDVVIMSSHREGLSLSNLEGMASGRPFIASDVDGLHEIVDGYGMLFPHEDAQALANIVIKLSTDRSYATQVALKCQDRAKQFDVNVMARRYNNIYQELNR